MEKLNAGYSYIRATAQEVEALADEMDRMVQKYGWQDRTVMPWAGVQMTVAEITRNMRDYSECTRDSKIYLIDLANGLVPIMNAWEKQELTGIKLRSLKTGKVVKVDPEMADLYLDNGFVRV
jgi:hypothetical protein